MHNKKFSKRALATSLSAILTLQFGVASLPSSVFAVYLNTDYVVYSDEDITVNTNNAVINGNVFSGDEFNYLGANPCVISQSVNSDKITGNVSAGEKLNGRTVKPDYTSQLSNGVYYHKVCEKDTVLDMTEYNLSESLYVKGDLDIPRVEFSGRGYVRADGNIRYDAVKNAEGSEIFLYSTDGNITVQGADVTINGIIYAPNGTVELNAKNLTVNGSIVAENVEFNGTKLTLNPYSNEDKTLIDFGPDITFKDLERSYKENRKITLDISESFGIESIDTESLKWEFSAEEPAMAENIRIDEASSDSVRKNLIITEPGIYRVTLSGKDKDGNDIVYYEVLNITEDIAPVAGFWKETDVVARNSEGVASITLEDTSYSLDGDTIGSRVWSVCFDSDNDGDFSDETSEIFNVGNETVVTYNAESVGKYKFSLAVAEVFDDTIPSLVSQEAYLIGNTDALAETACVTEVTNEAPVSYSGISKAKNVDIVVTVGNADVENVEILNENISRIKQELESKGYSVNLSTVSTSTLTAKDTFAWEEYDHYNYDDRYLPTLERHILYEEDSIKMMGYSVAPLRDWLFVDDGINAKRVLSFDMVRDKTDWHSMEGGGFLFNTSITEEVTEPANPEEAPITMNILNGYCILLTQGGFKLIQLDNVNADNFRNGGISNSVQAIGKVLMSVPVANVYDSYNVKIIASDRILSVYINDEAVIDNFLLPDTDKGTGFGPIICHGSHSCSQQSYFTFSNIKMSTLDGSELSEVLDEYEWRDSAEHYVINLSEESVYDLTEKSAVGSAVKSLVENETSFIGLGTVDSKNQYDSILRSADGIYADWYDVLKNEEIIRNYILNSLGGVDYSVEDMITTSDEIVYVDSYVDKENDPVGNQVWKYELDASVYENSTGETGTFTCDEPLAKLESTGVYKISSVVEDDPTNGNTYLDSYREKSNAVQWTEKLYVHSMPEASVTAEVLATDDPEKFLCNITFEACDADASSKENKGISEEKFYWKNIDENQWHEGIVPEIIDVDEVYLQKYQVCDLAGQWSKPCIEVIRAEKNENTNLFEDNENPVIILTVSDENPSVGDRILISVTAEDNTEVAYVKTKVNGTVLSEFEGSFFYDCTEEGELLIEAECMDIGHNPASTSATVTVTDRRDLTAPEIVIDKETGIASNGTTLTISGYITDNAEFDSYIVQLAQSGTENYETVHSASNEVYGSEIAVVELPEAEGSYDILITAIDSAENKAFYKITVEVTAETIVDTEHNQSEEITQEPERTDTPAEITITSSAQTAEIGESINVTADAKDPDGLVSVKVYMDDELIAESPVSFRFSKAEACVVTVKVETVDAYGGTASQSMEIVIEDNSDKVFPTAEITSPANEEIVSGNVAIMGSAFDETSIRNYVVEYRKQGQSLYTPIYSSLTERRDGQLAVWNTNDLDNGVYEIRLSVTDNGGNTTFVYAVYQVQIGNQATDEEISEELIVFTRPQSDVPADDVIKIEADADESLSGSEYKVYISNSDDTGEKILVEEGVLDKNGSVSATVDSSMLDEGRYDITIAVKPEEGESVEKEVSVIVDHDYTAPEGDYVCEIVSPEEFDELAGLVEVTANGSADIFEKYKLEYSPAGEESYITFATGRFASDNAVSAEFDTTKLKNGYYDIRFTVYGDNVTASDIVTVSVKGNLAIGNFSLDFSDMEFDVNGIPVRVLRSYDSRHINENSVFGYGWSMSYDNVNLSISCNQSENWEQAVSGGSFISSYYLSETKQHRVSVDLGNGIADEFRMRTTPESQLFYPIQYGVGVYYTSVNGSGATLVPCNVSADDLLFNGGKLYTSSLSEYNPTCFKYTTSDGTAYVIDADKGLISITTIGGDVISFNDDGISSTGGEYISFSHDSEGRITEITDYTGKKVSYTYDVFGDLVSVTDIADNTASFVYDNHYIYEMYDPRGLMVSRNDYDDDGRLIKTTDGNGNAITYDHDVEGKEEIITDRNGGITRVVYDDYGNVLAQTDPMGNTIYNTFDSEGNLTSKTDAMGNVTTFKYDSDGNVIETVDAEGVSVKNTYNSNGLITSVNRMGIVVDAFAYNDRGEVVSRTDADGNTTEYTYDNSGNLTSISDAIGSYINMTTDSKGNVVSATDGSGTTADFAYDSYGNCISKTITYNTDGESRTVTEYYTYDSYGNIIKTIDNEGNITSSEYNSIGKVAVETDGNGNQKKYTYDTMGNLTKIVYSDGTSESFVYDKEGNTISTTDRYGKKVEMTYDKAGNLLTKSYSDGTSVSYEYDANYNLIAETDYSGAVTYYEYDKIGRNTAVIDAYGNRTEYVYNEHSLVTAFTDSKGNTTSYSYDNNGNRIKTVYPDGTSESSEYDARGLITCKTDANGYKTYYTYDKLNRLTSVTDALGNVTSYEYDELGNLVAVTDAENNVTRYVCDANGRTVKTINAMGQVAENAYDPMGNLVSSTDFAGNITKYTYDKQNRVLSKTTSDGTVRYSYSNDGNLASVSDRTGTTRFVYNESNGLAKITYPNGNYVEYSYDFCGRKTSVATAYGRVDYSYDLLGRMTAVNDKNGRYTTYQYDSNGNRSFMTYPNGVTIGYNYDALNRLASEYVYNSNNEIIAKYEYTYGNAGEILTIIENDRTVMYAYDALYRLISEKTVSADGAVSEIKYAYDKVSNRISKNENGNVTNYAYNALGQLVSENDKAYLYDNAGNLISETSSDKVAVYTYDAENRLVKADVNGVVEEYGYDYAGNRISKKTGDDYTYYLNDTVNTYTQTIAELDANGNVKCFYTRGVGLVSQERDAVSYYIADGHDSVRLLTDENGIVTDSYTYDAWGNTIASTGNTVNTHFYCGEELDGTTGNYYLRARYMNPSTGTFITMDTYQGTQYNPTSLNKYLYANANPVLYSDPSGHFASFAAIAINYAIGFTVDLVFGAIMDEIFSSLFTGLYNNEDTAPAEIDYEKMNQKIYSFEDLFELNLALSAVNVLIAGFNIIVSGVKMKMAEIDKDYGEVVSNFSSAISGAFTLGSAIKMRYDTYDFIFDYASDSPGYMERFRSFTNTNLHTTKDAIQGLIYSFDENLNEVIGNIGNIKSALGVLKSAVNQEELTYETYAAVTSLMLALTP